MIADVMLSADENSVLLAIRVIPRAGRQKVVGERAGRLVVKVTQPPLAGRANDAVRRLIAKAAGMPVSRVELVSGERGRDKLVRIAGISLEDATRRLT